MPIFGEYKVNIHYAAWPWVRLAAGSGVNLCQERWAGCGAGSICLVFGMCVWVGGWAKDSLPCIVILQVWPCLEQAAVEANELHFPLTTTLCTHFL